MTPPQTRRDPGLGRHVKHAVLLLGFGVLLFGASRAAPGVGGAPSTIAAIGFLLLAGTLTGELLTPLGLPRLTGYLIAGIAAGPHVMGLVDQPTVRSLSPANTLALSLIALAGGAELDLTALRRGARSLAWATIVQSLFVLPVVAGVFLAARSHLPASIRDLPLPALVGVSLLWGALALARSPSATLGILTQTRAHGSLTTFSLGFVMSSDIVVVVVLATVMGCVRPLIDTTTSLSLESFKALAYELFGSVSIGTTLGLVTAAYLRLVDRQMLVVLLVLGFGVSTVLDYLQFDALLTFMVAGFIVRNLSNQGAKLLRIIEQTGTVVYVVFFAIAGADLDVPLLRHLWPVALFLALARGAVTYAGARLAGRLAQDPALLRRWSWSGLVSQAGLVLGLAAVVEREFPAIGGPLRALTVASVAINQLVGPVIFKIALERAGETSREPSASLASIVPT